MKRTFPFLLLSLLLLFWPTLLRAECPVDCPGDVNGDCVVDMRDLAILSANWLKNCELPPELPVLRVTDVGLSTEQADKLAEALGLEPDQLLLDNGIALFIDPEKFQQVPTNPIDDPQLIEELRKGTEQDGDSPLVFEAFDFEQIAKIVPFEGELALRAVNRALDAAGLGDEAQPEITHTSFEAFDPQGTSLLLPAVQKVQIGTGVNYHFTSGGIPVLGPGAAVNVNFDFKGQPTQLLVARRGVTRDKPVPLILPGAAVDRYNKANAGTLVPEGDLRLVYYAPPLSEKNTKILVPHFDVGGILYGPEGQQANKLRKLIPATNDLSVVPAVHLAASVRGNLVTAEAFVEGGAPPYRYQWFSSSVELNRIPDDQSQIEYNAYPRNQQGLETIQVTVIDDNGVSVQASENLTILLLASEESGDIGTLAGGTVDFGVERAVSDLCAANQAGFINRFVNEGVYKRFNWTGNSSWERDFKDGGTGLDHLYVDNVDITFYCGHGYGGGFTFESSQDDGYLTYTDAAGAWGNDDLEYLSLLSCQVLRDTYDGKKWYTRWGPAFNGLHLLCGFQTNAYDWPNFGPRFADYTLGRNFFGLVTITLPVRAAWFKAKAEEQPADVEAVVMGVVGPGGTISGYNDYFWGQGPVSPDLRGSQIRGYWRIVYK